MLYLNFYFFTKTHFDMNYRYNRNIPYNYLYCLILTAFAFVLPVKGGNTKMYTSFILNLTSRKQHTSLCIKILSMSYKSSCLCGKISICGTAFLTISNKLSLSINIIGLNVLHMHYINIYNN